MAVSGVAMLALDSRVELGVRRAEESFEPAKVLLERSKGQLERRALRKELGMQLRTCRRRRGGEGDGAMVQLLGEGVNHVRRLE